MITDEEKNKIKEEIKKIRHLEQELEQQITINSKKADELYQAFIAALSHMGIRTKGGIFQAYMDVELINDGPVTILLDSQKLF